MTIQEARIIMSEFDDTDGRLTEEEFFMFTEAAQFLIRETDDADMMYRLGCVYEYRKQYDLAYKYYEMAAERNHIEAYESLGYIWYYGRVGKTDYEKAFYYFSKAACIPNAQLKLADMYLRGYYVEEDPAKATEILERLYRTVYGEENWVDTGICTRLAEIREKEGNTEEAIRLLQSAKRTMTVHISYNAFFGCFSVMSNLIQNLYRLITLDKNNIDFFDLYELLRKPGKVQMTYRDKTYIIEAVEEADGSVAVCFDGKWYRSVEDMIPQAEVDGVAVTALPQKLFKFEVV
ncbi:MAG: sel1 repeat family protein [Oscillospiraceae bacterium]|nr:sel1 repeat family protein [Oscillospiraceae bacterium]